MDTATEGGLSIYEDRAGRLWFNSPVGLSQLDPTGTTRQIPLTDAFGPGGPPRIQVNFFYEDSKGALWLATETGLLRFDPESRNYTGYTTQDGLPDNIVQCILPDDSGNLWVSTNNGISKFDPVNRSFHNYSEADGLQGNTFNRKSCFRDEAGWMYFGGIGGFNIFHPSQLVDRNSGAVPIVLTELQIRGKTVPPRAGSVLPKPIWAIQQVRLPYRDNVFSFEFAALSYTNPEKIRYRFRLDNLESQWTEVNNQQRYARYTDVRPGQYVFRAQASLDGGRTWEKEGTSLHVDIPAPWWMTTWSKAAALLIIVGLRCRGIQIAGEDVASAAGASRQVGAAPYSSNFTRLSRISRLRRRKLKKRRP